MLPLSSAPPPRRPGSPLERLVTSTAAALELNLPDRDRSIGRIVSVTGAKAIVLLDACGDEGARLKVSADKPEMGTLFAIETPHTVVLSIVSALNVPVPAHREGEGELWIAELGLVGELVKRSNGTASLNRGVSIYPRSATASASPRASSLSKPSTTTNAIACGSAPSARIPPSPP